MDRPRRRPGWYELGPLKLRRCAAAVVVWGLLLLLPPPPLLFLLLPFPLLVLFQTLLVLLLVRLPVPVAVRPGYGLLRLILLLSDARFSPLAPSVVAHQVAEAQTVQRVLAVVGSVAVQVRVGLLPSPFSVTTAVAAASTAASVVPASAAAAASFAPISCAATHPL